MISAKQALAQTNKEMNHVERHVCDRILDDIEGKIIDTILKGGTSIEFTVKDAINIRQQIYIENTLNGLGYGFSEITEGPGNIVSWDKVES